MKILVLNCGSSSVKYKLYNMQNESEKFLRIRNDARTYWNLKAPKQLDEKEITIKAAKSAIEKITNIALQEKNMQVAEFLSKNADLIIGEIFKDKK